MLDKSKRNWLARDIVDVIQVVCDNQGGLYENLSELIVGFASKEILLTTDEIGIEKQNEKEAAQKALMVVISQLAVVAATLGLTYEVQSKPNYFLSGSDVSKVVTKSREERNIFIKGRFFETKLAEAHDYSLKNNYQTAARFIEFFLTQSCRTTSTH